VMQVFFNQTSQASTEVAGTCVSAPAIAPVDVQRSTPAPNEGNVVGEPRSQEVESLCNMGFERAQVIRALQAACNDVNRAFDYLAEGIPQQQHQQEQHWPEGMLGPQVLTKGGMVNTREALQKKTAIMLYFSAHWCPPCRQFTPRLVQAAALAPPELAIIFVSRDQDQQSFLQYYSIMPWFALPFGSNSQRTLDSVFNVRGIPTVVILDANSGHVVTKNGVQDLSQCNFDLSRCLQIWGLAGSTVQVAPQPPVPVVQVSLAPERQYPEALTIDDSVADAAIASVNEESWDVQESFYKTALKIFENTLQNPNESKFRKVKCTNAALSTKFLNVAAGAGTKLLLLAGFVEGSDDTIALDAPPDGRCTAVWMKVKVAGKQAWEQHVRHERDARIQVEIEKDKKRMTRYSGEDGRINPSAGRKPARGG